MKKIERKIKEFVNDYSINNLKNIDIDQYVVGKGLDDTFCYRLEYDLIEAGDSRGPASSKFGVYYGKSGNNKTLNYRYNKCFKNDFKNVRNALIDLIEKTVKLVEFEDIESEFHGIIKYKIMFIYNNNIMIPSYVLNDLLYFAEMLDIDKTNSYEIMQRRLLEYKNKYHSNKTNIEFMIDLYSKYGRPINKKEFLNEQHEDEIINLSLKDPSDKVDQDHVVPAPQAKKKGKSYYYPRNPKSAADAYKLSGHKCEYNTKHTSFKRNDGSVYLEAHHLIPMRMQETFKNNASLDVPANIVCLCSECHNKIHYGKDNENMIDYLYKKRKKRLNKAGIVVNIDIVKSYYKRIKEITK